MTAGRKSILKLLFSLSLNNDVHYKNPQIFIPGRYYYTLKRGSFIGSPDYRNGRFCLLLHYFFNSELIAILYFNYVQTGSQHFCDTPLTHHGPGG